jgi:hypothetical protein
MGVDRIFHDIVHAIVHMANAGAQEKRVGNLDVKAGSKAATPQKRVGSKNHSKTMFSMPFKQTSTPGHLPARSSTLPPPFLILPTCLGCPFREAPTISALADQFL